MLGARDTCSGRKTHARDTCFDLKTQGPAGHKGLETQGHRHRARPEKHRVGRRRAARTGHHRSRRRAARPPVLPGTRTSTHPTGRRRRSAPSRETGDRPGRIGKPRREHRHRAATTSPTMPAPAYGHLLRARDTCSDPETHARGQRHMLGAKDTCSGRKTHARDERHMLGGKDTCSGLETHAGYTCFDLKTQGPAGHTGHRARPEKHRVERRRFPVSAVERRRPRGSGDTNTCASAPSAALPNPVSA